ncbi:uncharacterized protein [Pyxicephalus adspersus]|uniref:uncharacterized protein n=1 Tax=Pyxicephalus adspersus TaxID=30357 RepID=UPI003B5A6C41
MESRLPQDKLVALKAEVDGACDRKKMRLREFIAVFRKCLVSMDKDPKGYSSHSFRTGAARWADGVIRRIGRKLLFFFYKSKEEEDDENAVAKTQLFCLQTNDSPGPSIKVTPQHEEEDVDNQQEMQPPSIVNGSGREDQETPQGATSQADTEPVSQNMSTKPSDESGTWLHLKRDVPASNWMKCLQTEGETSNIKDDATQDELEATQSYIMDSLNIKRHPKQDHASLSLQDDNTRLCELAAPSTNDQPRDPINFEALTVPATQNTSPVPSIPGADSSVTATESLVTVLPSSESLGFVGRHSVECTGDTLVSGTNKSVVPATESPLKELNNMETQVTDDGATQALSLDLPVFDANAHGNNLEESFTADAAQSCSVDVEGTADHEAPTSGGILLTVQKWKDKLTDTEKGKPSFNRGLSRRKKEQPDRSTEILTGKLQVPEVASVHLTLDEAVELGVCESEQPTLGNAVSEMIEESKPEKVTLRRGRRRKSTENPDSKTRDELVVPTTYRKRTSRMVLDVEQSTSNEVRNQAGRVQLI